MYFSKKKKGALPSLIRITALIFEWLLTHAFFFTITLSSFLSFFLSFFLLLLLHFHCPCFKQAWSRFSGGAGAPGWVLEKIGMDISSIFTAEAAHVMEFR